MRIIYIKNPSSGSNFRTISNSKKPKHRSTRWASCLKNQGAMRPVKAKTTIFEKKMMAFYHTTPPKFSIFDQPCIVKQFQTRSPSFVDTLVSLPTMSSDEYKKTQKDMKK